MDLDLMNELEKWRVPEVYGMYEKEKISEPTDVLYTVR